MRSDKPFLRFCSVQSRAPVAAPDVTCSTFGERPMQGNAARKGTLHRAACQLPVSVGTETSPSGVRPGGGRERHPGLSQQRRAVPGPPQLCGLPGLHAHTQLTSSVVQLPACMDGQLKFR